MEQPEQPQLAGLLGAAVDEINTDEDASRGLAVLAKVGALDAYRDEVLRLGVAVPCAHGLRLFAGTAFADEAKSFFGSPRDGADVEAYLQERYSILSSQESLVGYVNSCDSVKKWDFATRSKELGDFNELKVEFKAACPTFFDKETGALKYTEPGFVNAFVDCITRRNRGAVLDLTGEPTAPDATPKVPAPPQLVDLTDEAPDATRKKRSLEDTSGGASPQASKKAKTEEKVEDYEEYFPTAFKACIVAGSCIGVGFGVLLGTG